MPPKTLVYIGPHDAVIVDRPDGSRARVAHGDPFVTTAEHAAALLEQPTNWRSQTKQQAKED